ncbi:oligosaccharide flippase family protein [Megasphaera massiliensis]|uniref:oligosaccharide flippase family protein n=1 Tax=Megasphaera massiliensis TaxID=1232428 RepID=UPI00210DE44A|nr:oligosaccharide flippase family protein [Megasphaera massiliensis]MCQ5209796.1 oligosaccharide flippase family protein [Megasphaera massiliensis]
MNQRRWGAILSYVNVIANVVVGLVYTPVMLRLLGQSEYGLYSLIGSMVGYLSVLDMGLGNTIVRYTAKNKVDGTPQREAELNGLFLGVYSLIGLLCIIIGAILYSNIDNLFGATLTDGEMHRARIMMILLICNFAFSFPFSVFASILNAYEKFIFLRVSNILRVIVNPLLVLPFLYMGYGSVMMVVVSTLLNFACLLANAFYCFRYLHIRFARGHFEIPFLKEIATYSFFIFLNVVMDKIYWGTGQFVLGIVSGTVQVAVYAIAMQFMIMYMNFSVAISGVMLPKVTMMVAGKVPVSELSKLMTRIGRLQYLVVGYICTMFFLVGREFITLWAGPDYLGAYPIVVLLMLALMIPLLQNVGISILQAMNLNRYRMTMYSVCAFAALVVSFPLASYWGGWGCAVATAAALIISTGFIMNRYYAKRIHLDMVLFWKNILSLMKGSFLLLLVGLGLDYMLQLSLSWRNFVILCAIDTAFYIVIMYKLCMNEEEKNLCRRAIGKILRTA